MMNQTCRVRNSKRLSAVGVVLVIGVLAALVSVPSLAVVVNFPDSGFEATIRDAIGKRTGYIYDTDLTGLTELSATWRNIKDLRGIEYCRNLTDLTLWDNEIVDISALVSLINLTTLDLSYNEIIDISPLAGLTNLIALGLRGNQIVDISPLSGLINLTELRLENNAIVDISALAENPEFSLGNKDNFEIDLSANCLDLTSGSEDSRNLNTLKRRGIDINSAAQKNTSPESASDESTPAPPAPAPYVPAPETGDLSTSYWRWRWSENPSQDTVDFILTLTLYNMGQGTIHDIRLWAGLYTGPYSNRVWDQTTRSLGDLESGQSRIVAITLKAPIYETACLAFEAASSDYPSVRITETQLGCY